MDEALDWEREGLDWPHRQASRFVQADGLRWQVQRFDPPGPAGALAPAVLLLHGTGASTHSWRDVAPLLAQRVRVVACDLPGHGFTAMPTHRAAQRQFSLPGMARALAALLDVLHVEPALLVGHSAGAAVALRMCLDGLASPQAVIGINAALLPWGGLAGQVVSPVTRLMAATRIVPRMFSSRAADPRMLQRLVHSTGSTLDERGMALYGRLVRNPCHAAAALSMMAHWDLHALARDLPRLRTPVQLVVGDHDRTISPRQATRVQALLPPACRMPPVTLARLGHLAHEEDPQQVAALVLAHLQSGLDGAAAVA